MPSRGQRHSKEVVEEEGRSQKSSRQEEDKATEASGDGMAPLRVMGEDPIAFLASPKAALPANAPRRAQAVTELQQQQGNTYVQQVVRRVQADKGSGQPVPSDIRSEMEQSAGYDLDDVRVHTDRAADEASKALSAQAFTMDKDVFFSKRHGQNLSSSEGKSLVAHELTHVIQQSEGNLSLSGEKVQIGQPGDVYEREADAVAHEVVSRLSQSDRVNHAQSSSLSGDIQEAEEDRQVKRDEVSVQRQVEEEEEEEIQPKRDEAAVQMQEEEELEEYVQTKRDDMTVQRQVEEEEEYVQAAPLSRSDSPQVPVIQAWEEDELVPMPWVEPGGLVLNPQVINDHLSSLSTTTRDVTEDLVPALENGWDYLHAVIPEHRERLTALAVPEQERMQRAFAGTGALREQMATFQTKESVVRQKIANNLAKAEQYEAKVHTLNGAISGLEVVRGEVQAESTQADIERVQREWQRVQQTYDDVVNVVTSLASVGVAAGTGGGAAAAGAAPGAIGAVATLIGLEVIRDQYHPRIESLRGQIRQLRTLIGLHRSQQASEQVQAAAAEVRAARHEIDGSTEEVRQALIEYQHAFRELAFAFRERGIQTPMAMLQAENEMVFQAEGLAEDIRRLRQIRETPPVSRVDRAIERLQVWRSVAVRQADLDLELRCDHNIEVLRWVNRFYGQAWDLWGARLEWLRRREYLTMVREARDRMAGALASSASVRSAR